MICRTVGPSFAARCYSDRFYDFYVTIPRCYKEVYFNRFFPRTMKLKSVPVECLKSVPVECFLLTYDLTDFKSRINRQILTVGSFKTFLVCFNIFVLCLVTPCLLVSVQLCME